MGNCTNSTNSTRGTCPGCGGEIVDDGVERSCLDCGAVEVDQQAAKARRRGRLRSGLTTALVLVGVAAVLIGLVVLGVWIEPPATGEVEGTLTIQGGALGDLSFAPTECHGAERIVGVRFAGVALLGGPPDTRMIRIVRHARDPGAPTRQDRGRDVIIAARASATAPWRELALTPKTRPGPEVEIDRFEPQSDHDNHTDRYRGRLEGSCALDGGGQVKLAIRFDHCRCNKFLDKRSVE